MFKEKNVNFLSERKYFFRNKEVSYHFCWLSDDTFYFIFADGDFANSENDRYAIQLKYHVSTDTWITEIWLDESPKPIRTESEGLYEYITKQEIEEIKTLAKIYL